MIWFGIDEKSVSNNLILISSKLDFKYLLCPQSGNNLRNIRTLFFYYAKVISSSQDIFIKDINGIMDAVTISESLALLIM